VCPHHPLVRYLAPLCQKGLKFNLPQNFKIIKTGTIINIGGFLRIRNIKDILMHQCICIHNLLFVPIPYLGKEAPFKLKVIDNIVRLLDILNDCYSPTQPQLKLGVTK
jgi:hypothetical protein